MNKRDREKRNGKEGKGEKEENNEKQGKLVWETGKQG